MAAPAVTLTATPSASAISSFVAPSLWAASVWTVIQPSQRRVIATAIAINSRVFASSWPVFCPAPPHRPIAPDRLWAQLGKAADPSDDLLAICIPIDHVHDNLLRGAAKIGCRGAAV